MRSTSSPARTAVCFLALGALLLAAPSGRAGQAPGPPSSAPVVARADDSVRRGPRQGVAVPERAIVPDLRRGTGTTFAPETDAIVARLDLATYDAFLQGISGWVAVAIDESLVTLQTRHSLVPAGQVCWEYAYETLAALGYDVRYQDYLRAGYALKNIIATIPGETTPERVYVLGGHIDSTSPSPSTLAPGAEDNGSGAAGVLAAAVALAGERFDSTIELVLFSGEEQGLWGSQAYVNDAVAGGRDVRAAVTFDMIAAWQNDYGVLIEGESAWQPLMFLMADAVESYTSISRQFSYFSFGSDHVPFQNAGIPAILAIDLDWDEYPYYHRTTDTYDRTTPALGLEIVRAGVAAVVHQAGPLGPPVGAVAVARSGGLMPYPNPASHRVTVPFALDRRSGPVDAARVLDVGGRVVRVLGPGESTPADADPSVREVVWDLRDSGGRIVRPGVYWVRQGGTARKVVVAP